MIINHRATETKKCTEKRNRHIVNYMAWTWKELQEEVTDRRARHELRDYAIMDGDKPTEEEGDSNYITEDSVVW